MTKLELISYNNRIIKKCRINLWGSLILVLVLTLVKLVLSNRSATWGRELEQIETETQRLKAGNEQLKLQLNQQIGGLDQLREKALELGYVAKPQYLHLTTGESVAQKLP